MGQEDPADRPQLRLVRTDGVVDYHYLKSVKKDLHPRQQAALEAGGHLAYGTVKRKLHHHSTSGFDPEGRDAFGAPIAGSDRAAISAHLLPKPTTPQQWKRALKLYGPLIVSRPLIGALVGHYVLVVGVTPRSFYYLDSLTGGAAYHDFFILNRIIDEVYFVLAKDVRELFKPELDAERKRQQSASGATSDSHRPREREARSDETSDTD